MTNANLQAMLNNLGDIGSFASTMEEELLIRADIDDLPEQLRVRVGLSVARCRNLLDELCDSLPTLSRTKLWAYRRAKRYVASERVVEPKKPRLTASDYEEAQEAAIP